MTFARRVFLYKLLPKIMSYKKSIDPFRFLRIQLTADVLQELSREARDRRWMRAEEKAAQLPIKMIIPMALFMIPSLYLMIFGPVIAEFVEKQSR